MTATVVEPWLNSIIPIELEAVRQLHRVMRRGQKKKKPCGIEIMQSDVALMWVTWQGNLAASVRR